MGTIITLIIVGLMIIYAIRTIIKKKQNGCSCSCSCNGNNSCNKCNRNNSCNSCNRNNPKY